jgi:hypothetical protein
LRKDNVNGKSRDCYHQENDDPINGIAEQFEIKRDFIFYVHRFSAISLRGRCTGIGADAGSDCADKEHTNGRH